MPTKKSHKTLNSVEVVLRNFTGNRAVNSPVINTDELSSHTSFWWVLFLLECQTLLLFSLYLHGFLKNLLDIIFVITSSTLSIATFITLYSYIGGSNHLRWSLILGSTWLLSLSIYASQLQDLPRISSLSIFMEEGRSIPIHSYFFNLPLTQFSLYALAILSSLNPQLAAATLPQSTKPIIFLRVALSALMFCLFTPSHQTGLSWTDDVVRKHGLLVGWATDALQLLKHNRPDFDLTAIRQNSAQHPIPALTTQITVKTVLTIQVESLDLYLLTKQTFPSSTPFLNSLATKFGYRAIWSNHGISGSSGADFQFLTGYRPVLNCPIYSSRALHILESMPKRLAAAGIPTYIYHNNTGRFWNRAHAFHALGIEHFEDLNNIPSLHASKWGVADEDVVTHILNQSRHRPERSLLFWITLSSHTPFNLVKNGYEPTFAYVDQQIKRLINQWSGESTLFIIYGDHPSPLQLKHSSTQAQNQLVPLLVFLKENNDLKPISIIDAPNTLYEIASLAPLVESALLPRVRSSFPYCSRP